MIRGFLRLLFLLEFFQHVCSAVIPPIVDLESSNKITVIYLIPTDVVLVDDHHKKIPDFLSLMNQFYKQHLNKTSDACKGLDFEFKHSAVDVHVVKGSKRAESYQRLRNSKYALWGSDPQLIEHMEQQYVLFVAGVDRFSDGSWGRGNMVDDDYGGVLIAGGLLGREDVSLSLLEQIKRERVLFPNEVKKWDRFPVSHFLFTLIHEVGHSLGLLHEYRTGPDVMGKADVRVMFDFFLNENITQAFVSDDNLQVLRRSPYLNFNNKSVSKSEFPPMASIDIEEQLDEPYSVLLKGNVEGGGGSLLLQYYLDLRYEVKNETGRTFMKRDTGLLQTELVTGVDNVLEKRFKLGAFINTTSVSGDDRKLKAYAIHLQVIDEQGRIVRADANIINVD